jgi:DnaD/phage-associated family protein
MISNTIVRTARFLKMPPTTQNLYFHLVLNGDDDGVVEAFPVMRLIGATEDDLKILVEKEFVYILNDDLVIYIKDWTEQNTIRLDRKIDSIYKDLLLSVVPEIDYKPSKKRGSQPVVRQMADIGQTNDSLSQDKLSQDKLSQDKLSQDKLSQDKLSQDKLSQDKLSQDKLSQDKLVDIINFKTIQTFYENNGFGTMSAKTREDFIYWIDDLQKIGCTEDDAVQLIIHAMEKSIDNNVRKYAYINSILIDWEQKKVLNVEQVKAMDKQRKSSNKANERVWIESGDDF